MNGNEILNVLSKARYDNAISSFETHTHQAYNISAMNPSDEIRIGINQQDIYISIHESFLLIEGQVIRAIGENNQPVETKLVTNAFSHLFDLIKY